MGSTLTFEEDTNLVEHCISLKVMREFYNFPKYIYDLIATYIVSPAYVPENPN